MSKMTGETPEVRSDKRKTSPQAKRHKPSEKARKGEEKRENERKKQ